VGTLMRTATTASVLYSEGCIPLVGMTSRVCTASAGHITHRSLAGGRVRVGHQARRRSPATQPQPAHHRCAL